MALTVAQLLAIVDRFDWDAHNESLKTDLDGTFREIVELQGVRGASRAGLDQFTMDDPYVQKQLTAYVGERIVQLDNTTRDDVARLVRDALEAGTGSSVELGDLIADTVREKFDAYAEWRADRIARTETANAYNMGDVFGYREAGVTEVDVSDGDDDEECRKAGWTAVATCKSPGRTNRASELREVFFTRG
jgi:hypothetical protein